MISKHLSTPPRAGSIFDYLITGRQMRIVGGDPRSLSCLCPPPSLDTLAGLLADSFEQTRRLRPEVPSPFRHLVFGVDRGESLEWSEVIPTIMAAHGLDSVRHRYLAVQHFDRDFEHIHFVLCRVGTDGSLVRDRLRDCALSQHACRVIEKEYGLRPLKSSVSLEEMKTLRRPKSRSKRPTRGEHEIHNRGELTRKEVAYRRLKEAWPSPGETISFEDFAKRLNRSGIEIQINKRGSRVGITYCFDGDQTWKASELGQDVLWSSLSPHISAQVIPEDIDHIRSIRPATRPSADDNPALPANPKPPIPSPGMPAAQARLPHHPAPTTPAINLLDLLDTAYATLSRSQTEAARRRTSGAPIPPVHRGFKPHSSPKGFPNPKRR